MPTGRPQKIRDPDEETNQSHQRENEIARILARAGYRLVQQPSLQEVAAARARTGDDGRVGTRPDYLIEGRVFDCYAPTGSRARNAWSEVQAKLTKRQTQRVVLDLRHWSGDVSEFRQQFESWPMARPKEAKIVTRTGEVLDLKVRGL